MRKTNHVRLDRLHRELLLNSREIELQLKRLGLDTDSDPYSGIEVAQIDKATVALYDDYDTDNYDSERLLQVLFWLRPEDVTLESDDARNIWGLIACCLRDFSD